jgi:hypothetical protein
MDTELMLTLKSIESDVATIYFEGSIFTPEGYEQEVNGAKIKVTLKGTQQGLLKVNKNTGWIISSNITQSFDGNVEAQGMQIPLSVTSISSTTDN